MQQIICCGEIEASLFDTRDYSQGFASEGDTDQRYTPLDIVEKVGRVLGGIGLDPTSNDVRSVDARHHITKFEDCLLTDWSEFLVEMPTVFMNPPYSNSGVFLSRMAQYLRNNSIDRAVTLTLAGVLANKSTQPLIREMAIAVCHPFGRINFIGGGKSNDRDVVFILWGKGADVEKFEFELGGLVARIKK